MLNWVNTFSQLVLCHVKEGINKLSYAEDQPKKIWINIKISDLSFSLFWA